MAELWQFLEYRTLFHQLQHRRLQKFHQCSGGVLGVSWTYVFLLIIRILFCCELISAAQKKVTVPAAQ